MVMRLVRDDDVREDGGEPQEIAAKPGSRPRKRSRPASPPGPRQLKMSTDEQLDTIVPDAENDGASDRDVADAEDRQEQEQPDGPSTRRWTKTR